LPAENLNEKEIPTYDSVARLVLLFIHGEESVREFYADSRRFNERVQNQNTGLLQEQDTFNIVLKLDY
jgi:hypothetical protein